eukprot:gnl/TRDRNA2_/TRDRNA2_184048_c0_seq1.p1 gnl/TRDRNA2_/TRDRNA2_184048_c0~~gnl/TRDRNA2_/TRDRNA2_184048_c0_seq1.p1  ORF type:complete len:279 (+),score=61.67 gnl/TRDRNA2_/TRDRNA2_184048_c0_seq1:69-905(+)
MAVHRYLLIGLLAACTTGSRLRNRWLSPKDVLKPAHVAKNNTHVNRTEEIHRSFGYFDAVSNFSGPPKAEDYRNAYDYLYEKRGYHADTNLCHEVYCIQDLVAREETLKKTDPPLHSVVVLGCSHGKGAKMLADQGFEAHGIDVAKSAIAKAREIRGRTCGPAPPDQCFVQGSLTALPYKDDQFDAGLSADVLEHIAPEDVDQVVREISRVVKHYLFVQIASFKEKAQHGEKAGMKNLHLTVEDSQWWQDKFAKGGWRLKKDRSDQYYVQLELWKRAV